MTDGRDRRSVLRAGAALGAIGLAGCLGDGDGDEEDGDEDSDGNATPPNGSDPGDSVPPNGTDPDGNTTDPENGTDGDGNSTDPDEEPDDDPEPDPEPVTSWPMHQRDAQNTAAAPEAAAPTENVGELWRISMGEGVASSPVVADGMVYVRDVAGTVHAISTDGDEQWTASVPEGELSTTPAIYEDLLLVPYGSGVQAFDRNDGSENWHYEAEYGTTDLTVADDAVFFGNTTSYLHAVEAATGERRWRYDRTVSWAGFLEAPAVYDEEVIAPRTKGDGSEWQIAAIGIETGFKRPAVKADVQFQTPVSIVDGTFVVGADDGIYAYDDAGTELWHVPTERPVETGLAVAGETVYGMSTRDFSGTLYAVDVTDGTKRWVEETDNGPDTGAVVVGDSVIYGDGSRKILAYDRNTGEERWRVDAPWEGFEQCAFTGGALYFAGSDGTLLAYGEQ